MKAVSRKRVTLLVAAVLLASCASRKVLVPPRVDLHAFGTIGLIQFSPQRFDGSNQRATAEFLSAVHAAQPGVPVVELGDQEQLLSTVRVQALTPDAIRAIGRKHRVDTLALGTLDSERVEPSLALGRSAEYLTAGAALEGALSVRLIDARTGATVWSTAVRGRQPFASVRVAGGDLAGVTASDPGGAAAELVRNLVGAATVDFRPTWVRE